MPTSHLLEIHPNIIHPPTPRFLQWSLSLRFPHKDPIHPPLLTHTRSNVQHWEVKLWKNSLKPLTVDLTICFLLQWSKQVQFLQRKQFGKLFMVMAALPTTNRWGYKSACGGKRKQRCEIYSLY